MLNVFLIVPFMRSGNIRYRQTDRPHMTIWRMRTACWITKATNTNSKYVKLIAFLPQQWLHKRVSVLRYTYIARYVIFIFTVSTTLLSRM